VEAARAANPSVTILAAQIIPMNVTEATCGGCSCAACATAVPALNARIVSWAASLSTASSAVRVVDQFTGFDATLDNRDGVHPNDLGARKIADRWYEALAPLF
jgi:acyl-CoA thioesterase I